jgi:hypothetical protein
MWQGHEADHLPPFSAKVNMVDLYCHSPIHLHGVVVKYRDDFDFTPPFTVTFFLFYGTENLGSIQ